MWKGKQIQPAAMKIIPGWFCLSLLLSAGSVLAEDPPVVVNLLKRNPFGLEVKQPDPEPVVVQKPEIVVPPPRPFTEDYRLTMISREKNNEEVFVGLLNTRTRREFHLRPGETDLAENLHLVSIDSEAGQVRLRQGAKVERLGFKSRAIVKTASPEAAKPLAPPRNARLIQSRAKSSTPSRSNRATPYSAREISSRTSTISASKSFKANSGCKNCKRAVTSKATFSIKR